MKIFYDLRLGYLVDFPGSESPLTTLQAKSGDGEEVIIQFGRSSDPTGSSSIIESPQWTPENLIGGTVITAALKLLGEYSDGTLLASNSTWTHDAVETTYTGALNLNTTAINNALERLDADDANDIAEIECGFEVTFQAGGSGGWRSSVLPVTFTIYHDIIAGDEATPANADDPTEYLLKASGIEFLPTVTGKAGGTSSDLDAIPTVGVTVGKMVQFLDTDSGTLMRQYRLEAGTDAESEPNVIRPDDYASSTNEKVWRFYALADLVGLGNVVEDTTPQLGGTLDANGKQIRESKGADVASASSLTLGNDGNYFDITGTTAITSIAGKAVGTTVKLHFDAALTLTHHATDLILPSGANITTAAGDEAEFVEYATGDWRCTSYQRADGTPLVTGNLTSRTMYVPASDMIARATLGAATTTTESSSWKWTLKTFDFDQTDTEYVQFIKTMPADWDLGTITAKFYWTAGSSSGTVRWALQAVSIANDAAVDTAPGTAQSVTDTLLAINDMHITASTPAITIAGTLAASNPVFFNLVRSPSGDTLAADARLIGVEITYGTL